MLLLLFLAALTFFICLFFSLPICSLRMNNCHERSLMIIFSCITVTFLFCHFPRVILNIYEFEFHRNQGRCRDLFQRQFIPPQWYFLTTYLEKILLILNASANFVYYCFSGNRTGFFSNYLFVRLSLLSSSVAPSFDAHC